MKNKIILVVFALLTLLGCGKKNQIEEDKKDEKATVKEFRALLPTQLSSIGTKYAIYLDKEKKEHRLKIVVSFEVLERITQGMKYPAEKLFIDFTLEQKNVHATLDIQGSLVGTGADLISFQEMFIEPIGGPYPPFGIDLYYNRLSKSIGVLSAPKIELVNIQDKIFRDVYPLPETNIFLYQSFRFNFEHGLVSFADSLWNLYVFDRFE
jgi:hypothetical protein